MLRGIVFDMDGVVIDSHPAHRAAWKSFLKSVGRTTSDSELEIILDGGKREEILRYFLGELQGWQIAEYGKRKDELLRNYSSKLEPMTGIVELLEDIAKAGVQIGLATSASRGRVLGTLQELGLTHYFDIIVTGDEVPAGKPDPAIYRLAAERMQQIPASLLAVEDAVSGVKAARGAGMACVGVAHNGRAELLRSAGADPIIEDFRALTYAHLQTAWHQRSMGVSSTGDYNL